MNMSVFGFEQKSTFKVASKYKEDTNNPERLIEHN